MKKQEKDNSFRARVLWQCVIRNQFSTSATLQTQISLKNSVKNYQKYLWKASENSVEQSFTN